jgi:hypothetical protein
MSKQYTIIILFIATSIYGLVCAFRLLIARIGVHYTLMAIGYASLFLLLWQLIRLIRAVNRYKQSLERSKRQTRVQSATRWDPTGMAPSGLSTLPSFIFGQRVYTWEQLVPIYLFLAAVLWAIRYVVFTVL